VAETGVEDCSAYLPEETKLSGGSRNKHVLITITLMLDI